MASAQISGCGRSHLNWLTEVWAEVWILPDCWSVSRVWSKSFTFFPSAERRHARHEAPYSSPLPLCLFLGSCPENDWLQWTQEEVRSLRIQYNSSSLSPPSCLPAGTDKCTEVLQSSSSFTFVGSIDLFYLFFFYFCLSSDQKDWIWAGQTDRQTNRRTDIWTESSGHCGMHVATGLLFSLVTKTKQA